ncbi:MAG: ABC transporter permease [Oscillospiraceae bacterium]|nr:ABC transporter permease [Oscillospiraceae bacterium]
MNKKDKGIYKSILVVSVIIFLWWLISYLGIFSSYVFPSPQKVLKSFFRMLQSGELIKGMAVSTSRVLAGFGISFVLAFALGILTSLVPSADPWYRHILEFIRYIPPMALIPLLILWFGIGEASKIIIIVLTSFFPIFLNTNSGLAQCDEKLIELGEALDMSKRDIFFKIRLPSALPNILVGMRIGLGYSWRAIIGAEMIAAASGIGYLILDAQALSRTDKVLVGIIVIGLIGYLTDVIFGLVLKRLHYGGGVQNA